MHKIKQILFLNSSEVKEYVLSPALESNPIYITEEGDFLVPRFGSELYYELTRSRSEILSLRDLISRNTITLDTCKPPEKEVKAPVVDRRSWLQKLFCTNPDDPDDYDYVGC